MRSPDLHRLAVDHVIEAASVAGWTASKGVPSRWPGPSGNREFFLLLTRRHSEAPPTQPLDTARLVRPDAHPPPPGVV